MDRAGEFSSDKTIQTIRISSDADLFLIAAIGNLYTLEMESRIVTPRLEGLLPGELVYTIFEDSIALAGTDRNRVLQYDPEAHVFRPFLDLPPLPGKEDPVRHIFRTQDGVLWVVTENRTFQVLPRRAPFQKIAFPDILRPAVRDIAVSHLFREKSVSLKDAKERTGYKFREDTLRNELWLLLYQYLLSSQ